MQTALRHKLALLATAFAAALLCASGAFQAHAEADEPTTVPLLVVVIEFDDGAGSATYYDDEYDWSATIFGKDDSLASYYTEMSDGAFTFSPASESSAAGVSGNHCAPDRPNDGIVHVTLPEAHQAWGMVNNDAAMAHEFGKVMMRAIAASRSFVDYDAFDANGDGVLGNDELAVCFCLAGYDASAVLDPARSDIPLMWPHTGYFSAKTYPPGGGEPAKPSSYIALAERIWYDGTPIESAGQEPLGVLYHELAHSRGLPDLYPLNANAEAETWGAYKVGALSLMDEGGWAEALNQDGSPSNAPMALDAWSRYVLGWEMPQVATQSGDYVVRSQLADGGYQSLIIPTYDPNEYYIVENRQPEGIDSALSNEYAGGNTAGGLVIWHVDKTTLREFCKANTINDTTHQPAVMETYFEVLADGSGYATAWDQAAPDTEQPFYDSSACARNFGDALAQVNLPLYNDDPNAATPSGRLDSGIVLQFPSESSREMTVRVEMPSQAVAQSSREYARGNTNGSDVMSASDIACAALMRETGADVALVGVDGIRAGIPEGALSWGDVYAVLPSDSTVSSYSVTGSMILDMLEQIAGDGEGSIAVGGVSFTADMAAPQGSRISEAAINSSPIDPEETYTIAATQHDLGLCPALAYAVKDFEMPWGSPADALRSFVLIPNWEETAEFIVGTKTYIEPQAPEASATVPTWALVLGALICVVGAFTLALLLRRGKAERP